MLRFATVLGLDLVDTSPNPPSGQLAFYARNGRLHTKDSGGSEVAYATTAELPPRVIPYSIEGELEPIEGRLRLYNDSGQPWNIVAVRATVSEPPTGSSLIVDVNIDGETIFTDQSKRPMLGRCTGPTPAGCGLAPSGNGHRPTGPARSRTPVTSWPRAAPRRSARSRGCAGSPVSTAGATSSPRGRASVHSALRRSGARRPPGGGY